MSVLDAVYMSAAASRVEAAVDLRLLHVMAAVEAHDVTNLLHTLEKQAHG